MYISRPCALGGKQSNEGLGAERFAGGRLRLARVLAAPPRLALLLQLVVLYSVGAPRQSRLEGAGLCLRGFGKEFENRREALPGSELVTVGAC